MSVEGHLNVSHQYGCCSFGHKVTDIVLIFATAEVNQMGWIQNVTDIFLWGNELKKKPKGTLTGHLEFYIHLQQSGVAVKVRD